MSTTRSDIAGESNADRYARFAIVFFFAMLAIPGSLHIGIRMNPMRFYLLLLALPMLLRLMQMLGDRTLRFTAVDALVLCALAWSSLATLVNHGTSGMLNAFSSMTLNMLAYMVGRLFVRSAEDFRFFFRCFLGLLIFFLPFALVELFTHNRLLDQLVGRVLTVPPGPTSSPVRFGLMRVKVAFETFLVYGPFCALGFANVWYCYAGRFPRNLLYAGFVVFMAALSISTSALLTLTLQAGLMIYQTLFKRLPGRWILLVIAVAAGSVIFELIMGMSPIDFLINKIMFSHWSGWARRLHLEYGLAEILRHPLFGVGFNEWRTPYFLSTVVDSHWLALTLAHGIPAFLLAVVAYATHFFMIAGVKTLEPDAAALRTGYLISLVTAMVMFFYNSFFHNSFIFFMAFIGAAAWFYDPPTGPAPDRRAIGRTRMAERARERESRRAPSPHFSQGPS